ncbi:MAG TPA: hypothetical protein VHB21_18210, partial [Minicystis sp.]|nr:hypothetical protein [Minicystis sp.]
MHRASFFAFGAAAGLAGVAAAAVSCATLDPIPLGQCGNGVVEPDRGEDCEPIHPRGDQSDNGCGVAGPSACRYVCGMPVDGGVSKCPKDEVCSLVDRICRRAPATFEQVGPAVSADHAHLLVADFQGALHEQLLVRTLSNATIYTGGPNGFVQIASLPVDLGSDVALGHFQAAPASIDPTTDDAPDAGQLTTDLAFAQVQDRGAGVLLGSSTGVLVPAPYANFDIPSIDFRFVSPEVARSTGASTTLVLQPILALQAPPKACAAAGDWIAFAAGSMPFACAPGKLTDLADIAVAQFAPEVGVACNEFVVAPLGQPEVFAISPCKNMGGSAVLDHQGVVAAVGGAASPGDVVGGPFLTTVAGRPVVFVETATGLDEVVADTQGNFARS